MTGNTQNIIRQLFQAKSLEEVDLPELEKLVEQYPYFNAGHYLLSRKLKLENNDKYLEQSQMTALYFTNPFWMQWLLKNANDNNETVISKEPPVAENDEILPSVVDKKNVETGTAEIKENHDETPVTAEVPTAQKEASLLFEPYQTIDYFASQGIKFIQEANPADKLGKQLKSFTEWLKTMKKLPQKAIETESEGELETTIENNAAQSIEEKEVLTETMAEVLIKQGKFKNAEEVYRKLSLLNPDKSAYFAARIENLNVN